jgi:hypothetical protein
MDPSTLAQTLFASPLRPVNSCQLQLDECDDEYIFQLLLNVLNEGIVIKYGENADLGQVNDQIKQTLNDYMNSIGFNVFITKEKRKEDVHQLLFTDVSDEAYYCIIKKNDYPDYFLNFAQEHSGHDKHGEKFKFILNLKKIERNNLNEYYCVYFPNKNEKMTVKFTYIHQ